MPTHDEEPVVDIRPAAELPALASDWRDLESRTDGSFFQSWAWTGCLIEERFDDPWLLSARRGERVVALALFNRGKRLGARQGFTLPLLLGESGEPRRDSIFIEHNGILVDRAEPASLAAHCWRALARSDAGRMRWVLSGVPQAVGGQLPRERVTRSVTTRPAPGLSFAQIPAGTATLDIFSPNTRQQLRRSLRAWEAIGAPAIDIARDAAEAGAFLAELAILHQRYWTGRGKPGAFAEPFFGRFHRALLGRAQKWQRLDLIRLRAGARVMGYLYNLVHRGWVAAYQSGFDFADDSDKLRPGLVGHLLAIEHYRQAGMQLYDFLGGEARYKRSLANTEAELVWLESRPRLISLPAGRD